MKDDNDRKREGTLPTDPEADAEPMGPPQGQRPSILEHWRTLEELRSLELEPPRREWLLSKMNENGKHEGVLPLGKVGMLVAQGGAGKTIALCQLALSVAASPEGFSPEAKGARARLAWLGFLLSVNPGRVLLALGEEDAEEVHRRMYNAAKAMNLTPEERTRAAQRIVALPLAGVPCAFIAGDDSEETHVLAELRAKLAEESSKGDPFRLVLLDPLSRWAGADTEKDNAAATRFVQAIESLAAPKYGDGVHGPTVIVAHHIPKAAKTTSKTPTAAVTARGVSALTDGARWEASLTVKREWKRKGGKERLGELPLRVLGFAVTKNNYAARYDAEHLLEVRPGDEGATLHVLTPEETAAYVRESREADAQEAALEKAAKKAAEDATKKATEKLTPEQIKAYEKDAAEAEFE